MTIENIILLIISIALTPIALKAFLESNPDYRKAKMEYQIWKRSQSKEDLK